MGWMVATGVVMAQPAATNAPAPLPASVAAKDTPPQITTAMQMPKGPDQVKALQAAAVDWAKKDPSAVLAWLVQLPPDLYAKLSPPVSSACATTDGKGTADWLVQSGQPAVWALLHFALVTWGKSDPEAAAAWCMQVPSPLRSISFFSVADGWCRKNPPSAAAWVMKVPALDDRLAALQGVALLWDRGDNSAATAWIKQLPPPEMKIAAKVVADDWRFARFPSPEIKSQTSAKAWLAQLPLSEADQADILKTPPLDPRRLPATVPAPTAPAPAH